MQSRSGLVQATALSESMSRFVRTMSLMLTATRLSPFSCPDTSRASVLSGIGLATLGGMARTNRCGLSLLKDSLVFEKSGFTASFRHRLACISFRFLKQRRKLKRGNLAPLRAKPLQIGVNVVDLFVQFVALA